MGEKNSDLVDAVSRVVELTGWNSAAVKVEILEHWACGLAFEVPGRFCPAGTPVLLQVPDGWTPD